MGHFVGSAEWHSRSPRCLSCEALAKQDEHASEPHKTQREIPRLFIMGMEKENPESSRRKPINQRGPSLHVACKGEPHP